MLVEAPHDDDALHETLNEVSDEVMAAVRSAAAGRPDCTPVNGASYHYLDDEHTNAAPCSRCREWTTDGHKPDPIDVINRGSSRSGRLICEQCRVYLIEIGALARPNGP